jgi:hypothetical protein
MEGINQMKSLLTKKHKLYNSISYYVLRNKRFTHQQMNTETLHTVFSDKFGNSYGLRLIQNTKDNNYEVAVASQSQGFHLGTVKLKTRKEFIDFINKMEVYSLAVLKALQKEQDDND